MKILSFLTALILVITFTTGCEEEFEVTADYQDITVVYGLLDRNEDTTYLRINKAFLGEGDVMAMALIEDSSTYKTELSAVIYKMNGSAVEATYNFDITETWDKEPGTFYNPHQILYYAPMEIEQDRRYDLVIQVNGKEVKGSTMIVNTFSITKPGIGSDWINILYDSDAFIEWNSAKHGRRYEITMRFHFRELWEGNPDTVTRYIDWFLGTKKSKSTDGGEEMGTSYSGDAFYAWLEDEVPYEDPAMEDKVLERYSLNLEFIVAAGSEELNTYMEVNEPSSSIIQERPDYTNIENGLGIFSSRIRMTRSKKLWPETVSNIKNIDYNVLKFVY